MLAPEGGGGRAPDVGRCGFDAQGSEGGRAENPRRRGQPNASAASPGASMLSAVEKV